MSGSHQDPMNDNVNINPMASGQGIGSSSAGNMYPQANDASRYDSGNNQVVDSVDGNPTNKQSSTHMESSQPTAHAGRFNDYGVTAVGGGGGGGDSGTPGSRAEHIDTSRATGGQFTDHGITEVGGGGGGGGGDSGGLGSRSDHTDASDATGARFNDYGTEVGTSSSIGNNQDNDNNLGNTHGSRNDHIDVSRATGGQFNDYGTEIATGGFGSTESNQNNNNNLGNTRANDNFGMTTSAMDQNSGPGVGEGFDVGSGADTGKSIRKTGGTFRTSAMDHNSGPGVDGGFDVGSGADTGTRTNNFGSSAMDQNSGPGVGGGFDTGSHAAGGYNTTTSTNANESGSGTHYGTGVSSDDYADNHTTKPSMGDKIKGGTEKLVGKVTNNPEMVEKGQQRKQGDLGNDNVGKNV
ncbi:hypothetical protein MSAN_01773600 [Mycena sanguinolenta]|uniref:Uncharacterized protein n=1 Tax=Mycena sanguinolenta TaxID=230812 RepID=A0A8H7CS49_9AGAR|nr:hypothetical protein MSAN_01773600 [Mycena sanguinolenta]